MWKLQNFPLTQILREIKVGKFGGPKTTYFKQLEGLNFEFYEFLHFLKDKIEQINKIQSPKMTKKAVLELLDFLKLISRKIWVTENPETSCRKTK